MTRKTFGLIAGLVLALAVGFGCGSLWMAVKTSNVQARNSVIHSWSMPLELLTQNSYTAKVMSPKEVSRTLGMWLDVASMRLAYVYDDLPQESQDWIARYAKAAQNVATAQQGDGFMNDRRHLLIFVDCVQELRKTGVSVRECAEQNGMYGPSTANSKSSSTPEPEIADAR